MTAVSSPSLEPPERTLRRQFHLPEDDVEMLDASGFPWETVVVLDGGSQVLWLLVQEVPVPHGLEARDASQQSPSTITIGIRVTGYPGASLDMAYIHPPLARTSRAAINGLSDLSLDGRTFQQWSRHYAFDTATHSLFGHLRTALSWLEKAAHT